VSNFLPVLVAFQGINYLRNCILKVASSFALLSAFKQGG
jgi:hypothetical protein